MLPVGCHGATDEPPFSSIPRPDDIAAPTIHAHDMPTPRIWNAEQLACRLGVRVSWFYQHRLEPEAEGFPMKDNIPDG